MFDESYEVAGGQQQSSSPPFVEDIRSALGMIIGGAKEQGISSSSKKSKVDIKLQYGDFQENSSASISFNSNYSVQDFRSECSSSSEEILFVVSFGVASSLDSDEVKSVVDSLFPAIIHSLPFKTLTYKLTTVTEYNGERVMRVIISLNDSEFKIAEYFTELFSLVGLEEGELLKFNFSHSLKDTIYENNFKWSAQLKCSAYRDFIQLILNMINYGANEDTKTAIQLLNGFKNFEFKLEFDDVEKSMKKIVPMILQQDNDFSFSWEELKDGVIGPVLIKALLKLSAMQPTEEKESDDPEQKEEEKIDDQADNILKKFPSFYTKLCRNLTGIHKVQLVVGNVMITIGFTGLDFVHLLPVTRTDIENILKKQDEEKGLRLPSRLGNPKKL